ncbi:SsgA family sporulation/cell division regulator [Streptomyces stackebrandtii]|uniref:SsgA family sporulation/cell division regulator n=1 Tax=Streptomyces stackebrandtii TaxID=3051177 RepID=UPI0028DD392D|nr:SsgA family sporulation/cell division regulator [Streptomyces sp. DSM 40976]
MSSQAGETPTTAQAERAVSAEGIGAMRRKVRTVILTAQDPVAVESILEYSRHDPLVVTFVLCLPGSGNDRRWALARDLLAEGLRSAAGLSDVQVCSVAPEQVLIELSNRSGYVALALHSADVRAFLHQCDLMVPDGREIVRQSLDDFLATLLP